jgi:hypothetical protein
VQETCLTYLPFFFYHPASPEPAPDVYFCALLKFPEYAGGWLIPSVVFETILFALAARTLVKEFREIRVVRAKGLLKILVRDSFIYFFV